MAQRTGPTGSPHVITRAAHPRSLDVATRTRRYLWTMLVRLACFLLIPVAPGMPAKIACLIGAAILPAIAVLLANNADNHRLPETDDEDPSTQRLALDAHQVIPGHVDG